MPVEQNVRNGSIDGVRQIGLIDHVANGTLLVVPGYMQLSYSCIWVIDHDDWQTCHRFVVL